MELKDLKVGMTIVIIDRKYVNENMDPVNGGFIDRTTKKFFSDDMISILCGKKFKIEEIQEDDLIMGVRAGGFWLCPSWISHEYVAPPKPKVVPVVKPVGNAVPKKAEDGTTFGVVFKKLLKKHPELGVLSTNRLSNLRLDEIENICAAIGVEYNDADIAQCCRDIFDTIING